MLKLKQYLSALRAVVIGVMVVLALFVLWTAHANPLKRSAGERLVLAQTLPAIPASKFFTIVPLTAEIVKPAAARDKVSDLCPSRRFALGMIETGNNDREIGGAGEVSRYQLMPSVWRNYSRSSDYQNPQVSREVAQRHWAYLHDYFKQQTGREPDDFDMYVLWNTRFGYYAGKGFKPAHLHPVVRDRARRFVNLVERGEA
jgi:hypothetical protein